MAKLPHFEPTDKSSAIPPANKICKKNGEQTQNVYENKQKIDSLSLEKSDISYVKIHILESSVDKLPH